VSNLPVRTVQAPGSTDIEKLCAPSHPSQKIRCVSCIGDIRLPDYFTFAARAQKGLRMKQNILGALRRIGLVPTVYQGIEFKVLNHRAERPLVSGFVR